MVSIVSLTFESDDPYWPLLGPGEALMRVPCRLRSSASTSSFELKISSRLDQRVFTFQQTQGCLLQKNVIHCILITDTVSQKLKQGPLVDYYTGTVVGFVACLNC